MKSLKSLFIVVVCVCIVIVYNGNTLAQESTESSFAGELRLLHGNILEINLHDTIGYIPPHVYENLENIEHLRVIGSAQMLEFPAELLIYFSDIRELSWRGENFNENAIAILPPEIALLPYLHRLTIEMPLTDLPQELGALNNLSSLYLYETRFTSFPTAIEHLGGLQYLSIRGGMITETPEHLATTNLSAFSMDEQMLTEIPSLVFEQENLRTLSLANNQISRVALEPGQLANIWQLNLSHNRINSLPDVFNSLPELSRINLSYNQITTLPDSFIARLDFCDINIEGNAGLEFDVEAATEVCREESRIAQENFTRNQVRAAGMSYLIGGIVTIGIPLLCGIGILWMIVGILSKLRPTNNKKKS